MLYATEVTGIIGELLRCNIGCKVTGILGEKKTRLVSGFCNAKLMIIS
jgi:hypothetical protein